MDAWTRLRGWLGRTLLVTVFASGLHLAAAEGEFQLTLGVAGVPTPDDSLYELGLACKGGASAGFKSGEDKSIPGTPPADVNLAWFSGLSETYVTSDIRPLAQVTIWTIEARRLPAATEDLTVSWLWKAQPPPGSLTLEDLATGATRDLLTASGSYLVTSTRTLRITQVAPKPPEVAVAGNGLDIASGDRTPAVADHTDFGSTPVGTPVTRTFTVRNTGTGDLLCSGLSVPAGYSVSEGLAASIAPSGTDTFTVRLNATAAGVFGQYISFRTNDLDETPFFFRVAGTVSVVGAPVAPSGHFESTVPWADAAGGRGIWDLTGTYGMALGTDSLTMTIFQDARGRITGQGTLQTATALTLPLGIVGAIAGAGPGSVARLTLKGAAGGASARILLTLAIDPATRRLLGSAQGERRAGGVRTAYAATLSLHLPGGMDGSYRLLFDLSPTAAGIGGQARLLLGNGRSLQFDVSSRSPGAVGTPLTLALSPAAVDPGAKGTRLSTTLRTYAGALAIVQALSGEVLGQHVSW
jgi:hypothetical protein